MTATIAVKLPSDENFFIEAIIYKNISINFEKFDMTKYFFFSNNKKYPSRFHAVNSVDSEGIYHNVFDDEVFWEDADHLRVFKINS